MMLLPSNSLLSQARHPGRLRLEGPEGKRAHDQRNQDAASMTHQR